MYSSRIFHSFRNSRKFRTFMLTLILSSGYLCGMHIANITEPSFAALMDVGISHVSIIDSVWVLFFPFLLTTCFAYCSKQLYWLLALCFFRFFLAGYCMWGVSASIGTGGWLFACLYLFAGNCMLPADVWLWLQFMDSGPPLRIRNLLAYALALGCVIYTDRFFIVPLLEGLSHI